MIFVFDLDDTLYEEASYVDSGFAAVSIFLEETYGVSKDSVHTTMNQLIEQNGRGAVFDTALQVHGLSDPGLVEVCLGIYRSHVPDLKLYPGVTDLFENVKDRNVYLVTDGNPLVQQTKILSLGIRDVFAHIFLTSAFGQSYEKPSLKCFDLIAKRERVSLNDLCYVGDNPTKDFVGLRAAGAFTVRVMTGQHADVKVSSEFDANVSISSVAAVAAEIFPLALQHDLGAHL